MSTGKHLASILVLTLFITATTNIEEKSIQQHGKGYIVPSKNNYRLDKIGCYMHTRPKSTRAKLFFYQKATIPALCMLHLTTPGFRYRTKPWTKYHDLPMQHLWKWGRLGSKGSSMWQLIRLASHILHAYELEPLQRTPKIKHIMDIQQLWHTKFLKQHFRVCWSYYIKRIPRHL